MTNPPRPPKRDEAEANTRQCIVTRELLPKEALIRFVLAPDGTVIPDLACKLPGRGLWVKADLASVAEAAARQAFSRAAKTQARVPEGLAARVEELLRARALEALSFARKAGQVVTGYEKVRKAIAEGVVACLIHASDSGSDPLRSGDVPLFSCFSREALAQVLASENPVHVAVLEGEAAAFFIANARRFAGFS